MMEWTQGTVPHALLSGILRELWRGGWELGVCGPVRLTSRVYDEGVYEFAAYRAIGTTTDRDPAGPGAPWHEPLEWPASYRNRGAGGSA